jgi:hypothetical protein
MVVSVWLTLDLGQTKLVWYVVLMLISILIQMSNVIYQTNIGVYRILGKPVYLPSSLSILRTP